MYDLITALEWMRKADVAAVATVALLVSLWAFGRVKRIWLDRRDALRLWGSRPAEGPARVIDGDTLEVLGQRVRLLGMDAPEMDQTGGDAARRRLIVLIEGRQVRVRPLCVDVYGRVVARVTCARRDLSRAMVWDGYARSAPRFSWDYVDSESVARVMGRGLWAHGRLRGIDAPSEHRARMRRRGQGIRRKPWR